MGLFRHQPGCPCCGCPDHECEFYNWPTDDFDELEQVAGTWTDETKSFTFAPNPPVNIQVITTTDDNAVILTDPIDTNHRFDFVFMRYSGTVVWRAIVGWADADNYAYAEFTCVTGITGLLTGTFQLGEVIGGVDSYLTSTASFSGDLGCVIGYGNVGLTRRPGVCLNDGYVTCTTLRAAVSDASALRKRVGIKTISKTSGSYNFCDFIGYYQYVDCPSCRCPSCTADSTTNSLVVEMSDVAAGAVCSDVSFFNSNAYTLDLTVNVTSCISEVVIGTGSRPCDLSYLRFRVTFACTGGGSADEGTFTATLVIRLIRPLGTIPETFDIQEATFRYTLETCCPANCTEIFGNATQLDYVSNSGATIYDFTGATASVYTT